MSSFVLFYIIMIFTWGHLYNHIHKIQSDMKNQFKKINVKIHCILTVRCQNGLGDMGLKPLTQVLHFFSSSIILLPSHKKNKGIIEIRCRTGNWHKRNEKKCKWKFSKLMKVQRISSGWTELFSTFIGPFVTRYLIFIWLSI